MNRVKRSWRDANSWVMLGSTWRLAAREDTALFVMMRTVIESLLARAKSSSRLSRMGQGHPLVQLLTELTE